MSSARDFEKARALQAQGYSASYIAGKTGLSPEQAKNVVERQTSSANNAAQPSLASSAQQILAIHQSSQTPAEKESAIRSLGFTPVVTGGQSVASQSAQTQNTQQNSSSSASAQPGGAETIPPGLINQPMYDAAKGAANLQIQKEIENLRQAGQTERQKLVNENNLAVTGLEVKGKLDLQGIVNAGYKNIANIERGSNMFASLMGAFNF
ncbi:hypothetical protein EBT31_07330 [bacterium]|nr:hypothetical protein [bacterium]NBX49718.1 hypothetical protein [bacterium]